MARYVLSTKGINKGSYASNNTEAASIPSSVSSLFTGPENLTVPTMSEESPANDDYELTYLEDSKLDVDGILDKIHKSFGIIEPTPVGMVDIQSSYYNRFKVPIPNEPLMNAVPHIFFVKPSLNLVTSTRSELNADTHDSSGVYLADQVADDPLILYSWHHNPTIIKQLITTNNEHDFMLYLSNKASSFSLSDEELTTAESSSTYGGWKVPYGRTNIPSRTSGSFTVDYYEDMNLSVYELHKIWVEYIANVYHGKWSPTVDNIKNKIFDYMSSVYYILCANDGETILFWSKYTGVFPTSLPSSDFSYQRGNMVNGAENAIRVEYKYAWKEDFNPSILYDFNINADVESSEMRYQPTFDPKVGQASPSWVGRPYIELCVNEDDATHPYLYKLRFKSEPLKYASARD